MISLICSVQETACPESVKMLDKVIDTLRSTELYSPQMKEDHRVRSEDPVTNDLIGALLTVSYIFCLVLFVAVFSYYILNV